MRRTAHCRSPRAGVLRAGCEEDSERQLPARPAPGDWPLKDERTRSLRSFDEDDIRFVPGPIEEQRAAVRGNIEVTDRKTAAERRELPVASGLNRRRPRVWRDALPPFGHERCAARAQGREESRQQLLPSDERGCAVEHQRERVPDFLLSRIPPPPGRVVHMTVGAVPILLIRKLFGAIFNMYALRTDPAPRSG